MQSTAPISDLITGTVLYNRMVEDLFARDSPLTFSQYQVLFFLSVLKERRARIRDLSEMLVLSASTISDVVSELEEAEFAKRFSRPENLKAVWVECTHEGKEALRAANDFTQKSTRFYWDAYDKEVSAYYFYNARCLLNRLDVLDMNAVLSFSEPIYYIHASHRYLRSYMSWFKSTYNLGLLDVRILMLLLEWGKPFNCTDLAHVLSTSNSAISHSVRYLNKVKKYVDKTSNDLNKRESVVSLTESGIQTIQEIRERFISFNLAAFGFTREEFDEMLVTVHPRKTMSYLERIFGIPE